MKSLAELNRRMLLDTAEEPDKNVVVSAVSLYLAMRLAMNAAGTRTQNEILKLITGNCDKKVFNDQVKVLQASLNKENIENVRLDRPFV